MNYFEVSVAFVSLILGIAYPILIQITSDDKYSSDAILDLFEKNTKNRYFYYNLILSIICIGLVLLKLPPLINLNLGFLDYFLENSAKILLIISTGLLLINFFRLINLIQTFYRTTRLITFLEKSRDEVLYKSNFKTFEAMLDILLWSIQIQNSNVARKVSDYFSSIYMDYRENWKIKMPENKEGLIYPEIFYGAVYNVIQQGIKQENNTFKFLEVRTSGLSWLLGEFKSPKISENTYSWLWSNIVLAIENNRVDLVFLHWQSAHQYFQMNLEGMLPEHSFEEGKLNVTNRDDIQNRNGERELFLEFHFALGGLILYRKEYDLISKIFIYTTSQPPQYYLLPLSMNDIFFLFFKFLDPYDRNFPWITNKYWFPGLDGVNAQGVIKSWICRYITILYIRQFNIHSYYSFHEPTAKPSLPNNIIQKKQWLDNFKFLKDLIIETSQNSEIMDALNFKTGVQYSELMEEIETSLIVDYEYTERTAIPLKERVDLFLASIKELISPVLESLKKLKNQNEISEDTEKYNIIGQSNLMEKGAFTDNGVAHLNFHSFLPEQTSRKIVENLSSIFYVKAKEHYIVNQEEAFLAVESLGINAENYIIVIFGNFNLEYYIKNLGLKDLKKSDYKGVEIIHYLRSVRNVGTSIFVLKKEELPWINFNEVPYGLRELYELEEVNSELKIYGTVSDLNTNNKLREEVQKESRETIKDLEKQVFQSINFRTTLLFKKNMKMVRIQIKGYFDSQLTVNGLDDIKKF